MDILRRDKASAVRTRVDRELGLQRKMPAEEKKP